MRFAHALRSSQAWHVPDAPLVACRVTSCARVHTLQRRLPPAQRLPPSLACPSACMPSAHLRHRAPRAAGERGGQRGALPVGELTPKVHQVQRGPYMCAYGERAAPAAPARSGGSTRPAPGPAPSPTRTGAPRGVAPARRVTEALGRLIAPPPCRRPRRGSPHRTPGSSSRPPARRWRPPLPPAAPARPSAPSGTRYRRAGGRGGGGAGCRPMRMCGRASTQDVP
jgi:hypothetical protein